MGDKRASTTSVYSSIIIGNLGASLSGPTTMHYPEEEDTVVFVDGDPFYAGIEEEMGGMVEEDIDTEVSPEPLPSDQGDDRRVFSLSEIFVS